MLSNCELDFDRTFIETQSSFLTEKINRILIKWVNKPIKSISLRSKYSKLKPKLESTSTLINLISLSRGSK